MQLIKNFINGEKINISKKTKKIFDPSKGEEIGQVVLSDQDDYNLAIESSTKKSNCMVTNNPSKKIQNNLKI